MSHKDAPPETESQKACREWWEKAQPTVKRAWGRAADGSFLAEQTRLIHKAWEAASQQANAEVERLRELCGMAYQLAGVHDAPEKWLDALSNAASGRPFSTDGLLPYMPQAVCNAETRALELEREIEALRAEVERLNAESEQHLRQAMSNGAKARAAQARAERLAEALRELVDVFSESGMYDEEVFDKARAALEQEKCGAQQTINVVGMPEFDELLDHIYEYGTAAEGVAERTNALARAVIARYMPKQYAAAQTQEMSMTTETSNARGEWVLVPVKPTEAMREAFHDWRPSEGCNYAGAQSVNCQVRWEFRQRYAAMLAAAPSPAAYRGYGWIEPLTDPEDSLIEDYVARRICDELNSLQAEIASLRAALEQAQEDKWRDEGRLDSCMHAYEYEEALREIAAKEEKGRE